MRSWHATGEPSRGQFFRFGGPDLEAFQRDKDTCKDGFDEAIWYDRAERGYYRGPGMDCACARSTCSPAGPASCPCNAIGSPAQDASPWAIWGDQESRFYLAGALRSRSRLTHNDSNCSNATPPAHKAGLGQDVRFGCPFSPRVYADLAKDFLSRNARGTCSTDPSRACVADSECTPGACVPPARPFFLMLSFTSVHDGHRAPARTRAHYGTAGLPNRGPSPAYFAIMEETDAAIGAILAELEALGLDDETLVIFTSDQGPDGPELQFGSPMLNGAKGQVYEAGIRIPAIVRACGQGEGRVISDLGSHVDVYRTVLDAAGIAVPPAGTSGGDIDGRSWLAELTMPDEDWPPAAPSASRRDFAFSRYGRSIAAISRAGLFDGTAPSAEWYALPEAEGVCAFVGEGGLDGTGSFGVSRGPSRPLVLCDPDDPGADAACAALGNNKCRVIGKRCTGFGEPGTKAHDRPRCHNDKDCPGSSTCQVEGQFMEVPCNVCIRASWKLVTANQGAGPAATELYELSSDPEESRSYGGAAASDPLIVSSSARIPVQRVEQVLGGALDRWKCSCLDPPPAPFSAAVPMSGGVPGGTWEGREPSCRNLLPECKSTLPLPTAITLPSREPSCRNLLPECKSTWLPADRPLYAP